MSYHLSFPSSFLGQQLAATIGQAWGSFNLRLPHAALLHVGSLVSRTLPAIYFDIQSTFLALSYARVYMGAFTVEFFFLRLGHM
ncbi:hypothetical protein T440DRAFT_464780 [Plenodomus tracheiphilus IPT5]|uniref:Uncharacterized protein n=1 Tax=Plenodomus tracheiphilus IPT5 TaxID=1408161 RepID=A0A6A7BGZ8_9PLEO|nr:hypothetical protein T440DRAFT_464780 [Plenodomus tracheiphilus IPT5]